VDVTDQDLLFIGIGFIVLMIGIASFSIQTTMRRNAKEAQERQGLGWQAKAARAAALAEAIKRNPNLAEASSPEDLARLDEAAAAIEREGQLKREIEAVKAAEQAKASREEKARVDREKSAAKRQAKQARHEQLSEKYASKPMRRLISLHPWQFGAVGLSFIGLVAALGWFVGVPWVVREGVIASCDPTNAAYANYRAEPEILEAWSQCSDGSARIAVVNLPAVTPEILAVLARDPSSEVRLAVAQRTGLPSDLLILLEQDPDPGVAGFAQAIVRPDPCTGLTLLSDRVTNQRWKGDERSTDVDEPARPIEIIFRSDCLLNVSGASGFIRTSWEQDPELVRFSIGSRFFDGNRLGKEISGTWVDERTTISGQDALEGVARLGKSGEFTLVLEG